MKIAVMADIHSNHVALERCIKEAKGNGIKRIRNIVMLKKAVSPSSDETGPTAFPFNNRFVRRTLQGVL